MKNGEVMIKDRARGMCVQEGTQRLEMAGLKAVVGRRSTSLAWTVLSSA